MCLRFFYGYRCNWYRVARGALGRGAQTAASVQSISFDRDFLQQVFTLLKRPYDGCGAGAVALRRAPSLRAQVSEVGEGMTCRVLQR